MKIFQDRDPDPEPPAKPRPSPVSAPAEPVPTGGLVDVEAELRGHAKAIRSASRSVVNSVLKIGQHLAQAQDLLAAPGFGTFGRWVKTVGLGKSTAYRMIAVWEAFGDCPGAGTVLGNVPAWTLQQLASSPEAVAQVIDQVEAGERLDEHQARKILAAVSCDEKPARPTRPEPLSFMVQGHGAVILRPDRDGVDVAQMLSILLRQIRAAEGKREVA